MSPPTERFRKLSLGSMPPVTRLQSRRQREEDSGSESDVELDFDIDDDGFMVSPSNLKYSLDLLDEETRDSVTRAVEVPPQFVLRGCQAGDQRCLFLITEPIEYTVRTGTEQSGFGIPSCTCENGERGESPCRHILWLFDKIASQALDPQRGPLALTRHGYPAELGNPYSAVSDFHLDMLADSLHCDVVGQSPDPNPRRVRETRELLAALNDVPADEYRPDLFDNPRKGRRAIKRGDLEQTVFRMLLRNDDFFHYFLASMRADDIHGNRLRLRDLLHRADAALDGLQRYADNVANDDDPAQQDQQGQQGRPKDVKWCAAHLVQVTQHIHAVIHTTDRPLDNRELRAAARAATHILQRVVDLSDRDIGPASLPPDERNLFHRLIGSQDSNFALDILSSIPPEVLRPWLDDLVAIQKKVTEQGAPASYTARLAALTSHLGARWMTATAGGSSAGSGAKRTGQSQGQDRRAKRAK